MIDAIMGVLRMRFYQVSKQTMKNKFAIKGFREDIIIDQVLYRKLDFDNPQDRWLYQRYIFGLPKRWLARIWQVTRIAI